MTDYVEILRDSRRISASRTTAEQKIVIEFELGEESSDEPVFPHADFLGDNEDVLALETAYSLLPLFRLLPAYDGSIVLLVLDTLEIEQTTNYGRYRATANYLFDLSKGAGDPSGSETPSTGDALPFVRITFGSGSRTATITESLEDPEMMGLDGGRGLPNTGRAIGVTKDSVEGTEVYVGGLQLQVTVYYYPATVTFAFIKAIGAVQRHTNSAAFLGQDAEEVLLVDFSGGGTVGEIVPITYNFEIKENIVDRNDDPFLPITMKGHDVLDYRYYQDHDEDAEAILMKPEHRFIHKVYTPVSFVPLKFPTL